MTVAPLPTGIVVAGCCLALASCRAPYPYRTPAIASHQAPQEGRSLPNPWVGPGILAALTLLLSPLLPPLVIAAVALRRHLRALRRHRQRDTAVARDLPSAVELMALCTSAGLSLPLAHDHLARRVPGEVGDALRAAADEVRAGRPRADALVEAMSSLGADAAALARLLADHLRYGTPLAPGLARTSLELRLAQRRRAEEAARRVPVRLLGPLVACILPSFALLTVVPLLAASLRALPL